MMNISDHADLFARLTLLPVPAPPNLAEALGYSGKARWIGCSWTPYGDEVVWDDGRLDATGEWDAYLAFTQHPKVSPTLRGYRLGSRGMTRIRAKIDHKLIESLHKPAEAVTAEAPFGVRNA